MGDVAKAVNLSQGHLSKLEKGRTTTKSTAEKLAAFFAGEITEIEILYPERFFHPQQPTKTKETKTR